MTPAEYRKWRFYAESLIRRRALSPRYPWNLLRSRLVAPASFPWFGSQVERTSSRQLAFVEE
jgi:hypothetical protein